MNIILCGLPKCGKTTCGLLLAKKLGWTFIDTDHLIEIDYEKKCHKAYTCRQIFLSEGENAFRKREKRVIDSLIATSHTVIAVGGGCFTHPENISLLKTLGQVIYLKAALPILFERMTKNGLPAYLDPKNPMESFVKLAESRQPQYEAAADFQIDTHLRVQEEIVTQITEVTWQAMDLVKYFE